MLLHAGGSPAATYFSCFAKKSKQKKVTAKPLPFGFPILQRAKSEVKELASLRQLSFLIHFTRRKIGSVRADLKTRNSGSYFKFTLHALWSECMITITSSIETLFVLSTS